MYMIILVYLTAFIRCVFACPVIRLHLLSLYGHLLSRIYDKGLSVHL